MSEKGRLPRNYLKVVNKIPLPCSCISNNVGSWNVPTGNATLSVDYFEKVIPSTGFNSIKIIPTNDDDVSLTLRPITTLLSDGNSALSFHGYFKSDSSMIVNVGLDRSGEEQVDNSSVTKAKKWNLVRSKQIRIPSSTIEFEISIVITFSNHNQNPILLWYPALINDYSFMQNLFVRETVPFIPEVIRTLDSQQTNPDFPMFRFMELGLAHAGVAYDQFEYLRYIDLEGGYNEAAETTKSGLLDPTVADESILPWLANLTGTNLVGKSSGTTAWGSLPTVWDLLMEEIDPDPNDVANLTSISVDGSGTVTCIADSTLGANFVSGETISIRGTIAFNGQYPILTVTSGSNTFTFVDETLIGSPSESSGTAVHVDTSWIELELFNVILSGLSAYWRSQLTEHYNGYKAGTIKALKESIKFFLSGDKQIEAKLDESIPWTIEIKTLTSETIGGQTSQSSPLVLAAAKFSKPAGFKINHECVEAL